MIESNIKESGVYKILNTINNKFYIGSSVNIQNRMRQHKYFCKNKIYKRTKLNSAFIKYNEEDFKIIILELVEDKTKLAEREQYYLNNLKPDYNTCPTAYSMLGRECSLETRQKKRETMLKLGSTITEEGRKKISQAKKGKLPPDHIGIKIAQYTKEGILVNTYPNIKFASRQMGLKSSASLCKAVHDKEDKITSCGYIWRKIENGN